MKDNAVSEVVGVMLMLSVTIILVAVVAVTISSSAVTDNRAITADIRATGINNGNITLELIGGDSFSLNEIKITVGVRENISKSSTVIPSRKGGNTVTLGDRFILNGTWDLEHNILTIGTMTINKNEHLTYRIYDSNGYAVSSGEILIK